MASNHKLINVVLWNVGGLGDPFITTIALRRLPECHDPIVVEP